MQASTVRYVLSPLIGLGAAFGVWLTLDGLLHAGMSPIGLIPVFAAGIAGGFISALIAPNHKVTIPALIGVLAGGALALSLVVSRMYPPGEHNPLLWYWPAWLIVAFPVGGIIGGRPAT